MKTITSTLHTLNFPPVPKVRLSVRRSLHYSYVCQMLVPVLARTQHLVYGNYKSDYYIGIVKFVCFLSIVDDYVENLRTIQMTFCISESCYHDDLTFGLGILLHCFVLSQIYGDSQNDLMIHYYYWSLTWNFLPGKKRLWEIHLHILTFTPKHTKYICNCK